MPREKRKRCLLFRRVEGFPFVDMWWVSRVMDRGVDSLGCSDQAFGKILYPKKAEDVVMLDKVPLKYLAGAAMKMV